MGRTKLAGMFLIITISMSGCGVTDTVANLNLTDITTLATKEIDLTEDMRPITSQELEAYYGISAEDYVQFSGYISGVGTSADELVIIEASEQVTAIELQEYAQNRLEDKLRQAEGYLPEEYAVIEEGVVRRDGNYVALFVTKDIDTIISFYEKQLTD